MEPSSSPQFSLNSTDMYKAGRGLIVVLAGAFLTYLLDTVPNVDFGEYSPIVVSVTSTLVELARRWMTNYQK